MGHRWINGPAIGQEYETIQPGTLLSIEGMVCTKIKPGEIKLQDPDGQGIVVRVELAAENHLPQGLGPGSRISAEGEVVSNRRDRMAQIFCGAFPGLRPHVDADSIALPGVPGIYPNPLKAYREVLDRVLEGRQSSMHGDLNLRNVLLDEAGQGWLIDFARVDTRHNIFDFVKLETYVRLMVLGSAEEAFSLGEYVEFEDALIEATLQKKERVPGNPYLWSGYQVIRTIREVANKYMAEQTSFRHEYLPALFLYCLAVAKYYQEDRPQPTRLAFATACVLGAYIHGQDRQTAPAVRGEQIGPTARDVEQPSASIGQGQPGPAVPNLLPAPEVRPEELASFSPMDMRCSSGLALICL